MKVVGIVGSARPGGNTEILTRIALDEVQKAGLETELISFGKENRALRWVQELFENWQMPHQRRF